jgi:hypothetical protein
MLLIEQFGQLGAAFFFSYKFDVPFRDLSKRCFRSPLAEPQGCQSFLQPVGAQRYQCNPAHWHSTVSKTTACLPNL